jgi:hypothetical protein
LILSNDLLHFLNLRGCGVDANWSRSRETVDGSLVLGTVWVRVKSECILQAWLLICPENGHPASAIRSVTILSRGGNNIGQLVWDYESVEK